MTKENAIRLFQAHRVRVQWNDEQEKWFFSIMDVIEVLTDNPSQNRQGICPSGWHVPSDEEWKILEGAVDSEYGIGSPEWDFWMDYRGYDTRANLQTTSGWSINNGTDAYGFSALPGGNIDFFDDFGGINYFGYWWTSTSENGLSALFRQINSVEGAGTYRWSLGLTEGYSVRCLRYE